MAAGGREVYQTLKRWLDGHPAASIRELQALLDNFAHHYNHHRPHRACGRDGSHRSPGSTPTTPAGPAERAITTPSTVHTVIVSAAGRIDVNGYVVSLGNKWARRTAGHSCAAPTRNAGTATKAP